MNAAEKKKQWSWEHWTMLGIFLLAFGEMAWLSVRRALGLNALWFDLGVMTQSIYSVLSGGFLEYSNTQPLLQVSRLAGHVEVIYFLFAPLLKLYPSPLTLLVAQAFLYATGGVAFFLTGKQIKDKKLGLWLAIIYLWYPVAQTAVLFDFHGDTIAMPLLAWALYAYTKRSWKAYYLYLLLALLTKIYVAIPVFLLGAIIWRKGEKRDGIVTMVTALCWAAFAFFIRGLFTPSGLMDLTKNYFILRTLPKEDAFFSIVRIATLVVLLTPLIPMFYNPSIWLLPALSTAVPALFMHGYAYAFHHYAIAVPFFIYAIADAFEKNIGQPRNKFFIIYTFSSILILNIIFVGFANAGAFRNLFSISPIQRGRTLLPWVQEHIPENASIAASPHLSPHLALRQNIYQTFMMQKELDEPVDLEIIGKHVGYFVVDSFFETSQKAHFLLEKDVLQWLVAPESDFEIQYARDGIFIFKDKAISSFEDLPVLGADVINMFDGSALVANGIALLKANLRANYVNDEWQLTFTYQWTKTTPRELPDWYALTSLEGYPASRSLHLDTWASMPTSAWKSNMVIQDYVILQIPHKAGCYPIKVAWFDPEVPGAAGNANARVSAPFISGAFLMEETAGQGYWVADCSDFDGQTK